MSDSSSIEALEEFRRPVPGFWIFIGSAIFCWFPLFRLSGTPIWTGGDQTMWLEDGQRMLFGEALYWDFFQMTFPGTELLYYWASRLFGLRTWIPGALPVVTHLGPLRYQRALLRSQQERRRNQRIPPARSGRGNRSGAEARLPRPTGGFFSGLTPSRATP